MTKDVVRPPDGEPDQQRQAQALLEKRDRYIPDRIDQTLKEGDTGVVFLGALHTLTGLPPDIEVIRKDTGLPCTEIQSPAART